MKIITLNAMHTSRVNFTARFKSLVSFLGQEKPDVILLQEGAGGLASFLMYGTWSTNKKLRNSLNSTYYMVDYHSFSLPSPWLQYRNAILSKFPIRWSSNVEMPDVSDEPPHHNIKTNLVSDSVIDTFNVYNVHLSSNCNDIGRLAEITKFYVWPALTVEIIGGDFNCGPDSMVFTYLRNFGFKFYGKDSDWIAIKGLSVKEHHPVLDGVYGPIVSDHFGYMVIT